MRKPIIAANWKMHKTPSETEDFLKDFLILAQSGDNVDIVIAPPFISLSAAMAMLTNRDHVRIGAQNMHDQPNGAFTGEISPLMLRTMLVTYVILGHSERRSLFGETDDVVNRKVLAAHHYHLKPILCVGETLTERDAGQLESVLTTQLTGSLANVTAEQAQEAHAMIRAILTNLYDAATASRVRIQYGGSVKPNNMAELMSQPDVDGALVGGASLESGSFWEIVRAAAEANALKLEGPPSAHGGPLE